MMNLGDVNKQIINVTTKLIELGLSDDQNFPSLTANEINISPKHDYSIVLKNRTYEEMYSELSKIRIFNIKMIDGALIQMQYRFKDNVIEKHRLAFFPSPNLPIYQNDPNMLHEDNRYIDVLDKRIVPVPLRFDFDDSENEYGEKVAIPVEHPISHLTIGQYKNCRIPITSALTPYQFIEFIVRNFYNTAYESYSNQLSKSNKYFNESICEEEKKILNISIPINT